jgi:hypothetical protein
MLSSLTLSVLAVATLAPTTVPQDAQEILASALERQEERQATVDNYTVVRLVNGMEVPAYYEKIEIGGRPTFRMVSIAELERARAEEEGQAMSADDYRKMADAHEMVGEALAEQWAKDGGILLPGMDPREMMGENAMFLRATADAVDSLEASDGGRGDAAASMQGMAEFARRAELVGTETVDGREAYHLRAEDLSGIDLTQPDEDASFTPETISMWIDTEELVPLRMRMEGTMEADGETRPLTMERLSQDYRQVGPLYESYRQVMRISGIMGEMSEKDRKDLEKAKKEMEQLEAQLDEMPASARSMVEGQLKKARAQMEAMSGDGTMEMAIDVVRIEVNQGPPEPSDYLPN